MKTRTGFFFVILLSSAACQHSATNSADLRESDNDLPKEQAPEAVIPGEITASEEDAQSAIESAEQGFVYTPEGTFRIGRLPEGIFFDQGGFRHCKGYLTRNIDEDFCAAEVPSDWVPFEFDSETYYVQPLLAEGD